jgi:hypothetical protein
VKNKKGREKAKEFREKKWEELAKPEAFYPWLDIYAASLTSCSILIGEWNDYHDSIYQMSDANIETDFYWAACLVVLNLWAYGGTQVENDKEEEFKTSTEWQKELKTRILPAFLKGICSPATYGEINEFLAQLQIRIGEGEVMQIHNLKTLAKKKSLPAYANYKYKLNIIPDSKLEKCKEPSETEYPTASEIIKALCSGGGDANSLPCSNL